MVDFSHVASQKVSGQSTARYDLYDIDMEGAALIVAPASRSNKAYNAALIKLMVPQQRRVAGGKVNAEFLDKYRESLVPLYAQHIVRDWDKICDATGKAVPITAENAEAFLRALPAQSFDSLLEFCENEGNFRDTGGKDLAKN